MASPIRLAGKRPAFHAARPSNGAREHGFSARHFVIPESDREAFDRLRDDFLADIRPAGELEHQLFDQVLAAYWTVRRCRRAEATLAAAPDIDPLLDPEASAALRRVHAHLRHSERAYRIALRQLLDVQSRRRTFPRSRLAADLVQSLQTAPARQPSGALTSLA
ncbi:MAG: hypothetical protein R2729_00600 [Bryobacteraceae bacterium]